VFTQPLQRPTLHHFGTTIITIVVIVVIIALFSSRAAMKMKMIH